MGYDMPVLAIRQQIASAIDIMVHLGRLRDHSRRVLEISEVLGVEKGMILAELHLLLAGLNMNIPLETLLKDFGSRSGNEDIRDFANVVQAAKRSGGNLIHIIQKTVQCMEDKLAVEEEIATMLAARRLEERIMDIQV